MKITIFAATGGIGRLAVEQAVPAGHDVTAVARRPRGRPSATRVVTADLLDADAATLQSAVQGADAVLSGLGRRTRADAGIASVGTAAIVAALTATGVRRIVIVSAAPIGTVPSPSRPAPPRHDPGDGFFMRHLLAPMTKAMLRAGYADLALMEDVLRESDLDWTVVRPPRLTDKPLTGAYRTAIDRNVRGGLTISRADVAHLMLSVLEQPDTIRRTVGVANYGCETGHGARAGRPSDTPARPFSLCCHSTAPTHWPPRQCQNIGAVATRLARSPGGLDSDHPHEPERPCA